MAQRVLVLIGTKRGLFIAESGRGRSRWSVRGPLLGGDSVFSAAADTRNGLRLIAGLNSMHWGPTVLTSGDGGTRWARAKQPPRFTENAGRTVEQVWHVTTGGPRERGVLYCGVAPAALFRSEDGGKTWGEVESLSNHPSRKDWQPGGGGLCLHTILVDPTDPSHLLTGISAVGVIESFDGGQAWRIANEGLTSPFEPGVVGGPSCVHKVAYSADGGTLYMQNHFGVLKRGARAGDWTRIEKGLPSRFGFPMVAHPHDPQRAYVIPLDADLRREPRDGKLAVYTTRDGGRRWSALRKGLPDRAHVGILRDGFSADSLRPAGLYFGTTSGQVFASADEGESWTRIADLLPPVLSVRTAVAD